MKLPISLPKKIADFRKTLPLKSATPTSLEMLEHGMVSLADVIAPSSVEVDFRYIRVGDRYYSTMFIVGYPRYVSPGWLQPIIDYDHTLDISMFIYPQASSDVLADLRRKIAEMEATIASDEENGKPVDPKVIAALEDAEALQEELAKGIERFFQFSFYLTITAEELNDLQQATKQLQTALASLLLSAKPATLQMEEGFKSTIPLAQDRLYITRNMDTTSLASTYPFTSAVLTQNHGVMYGVNLQNGSLVIFDRFSLENANEVILGKSGAGKSYLIKVEIMRQFMLGTEVIVVDPEGEYDALAQNLGGLVVEFSSKSPIKMNPFDLGGLYEEGENELGLKILSLHGLLKIILGELDAEHDSLLDKALIETYRQKGITPDPATQKREAPLMEDLYKTLLGMENATARDMALKLEKFIKGSAAGIFNQQSNFDITSPLTVFSIRDLEEELRPLAMHIILDFVWTKVKKNTKRRLLILDEAWYMMKFEDSASFVFSIAKRARKYYLGLTTATQDVEDFLSTKYGRAVLTNSSIQMLLKQGTAEVDLAQQIFYLSEGERQFLMSAGIGEGLFFAGQNHVAVKVVAAPFEHELITSNPEDLEIIHERQAQELGKKLPEESAEEKPQDTTTEPEMVVSPQPEAADPPQELTEPEDLVEQATETALPTQGETSQRTETAPAPTMRPVSSSAIPPQETTAPLPPPEEPPPVPQAGQAVAMGTPEPQHVAPAPLAQNEQPVVAGMPEPQPPTPTVEQSQPAPLPNDDKEAWEVTIVNTQPAPISPPASPQQVVTTQQASFPASELIGPENRLPTPPQAIIPPGEQPTSTPAQIGQPYSTAVTEQTFPASSSPNRPGASIPPAFSQSTAAYQEPAPQTPFAQSGIPGAPSQPAPPTLGHEVPSQVLTPPEQAS